jgi:hypothetical protein
MGENAVIRGDEYRTGVGIRQLQDNSTKRSPTIEELDQILYNRNEFRLRRFGSAEGCILHHVRFIAS